MISIIVPVYNAEKYIRRCLDSIVNQTVQNIEIILVNDGSRDNSMIIMEEYAEKDRRIKIISQENEGVSSARNTGLKKATGEYILYIDADDWIELDAVEYLLNIIDVDTDIVFFSSDNKEFSNKAQYKIDLECEVWDRNRQMFEFMRHKQMTGMLWNKLIRRKLTDGIFFNEKTGYGEDAEFLWQILKKSQKMIVINQVLYHHVLEGTSISHSAFSENKFSAIPMWEGINAEVEVKYPELLPLAKERLMCAAVFSMYEIRKSKFYNKNQEEYIRKIVKENFFAFIKSPNISKKMKLYAVAIRGRSLMKRFL